MDKKIKSPEILAPAGNFEKMRAALLYGANAVYLAGDMFGMRAAADNFSQSELAQAAEYAHERGAKIYLTVNTMPRTYEYTELEKYINSVKTLGVDAFIISDIGVLELAKELAPDIDIHISTQASTVSLADCRAWHKYGASRVVLAREVTLDEARVICENRPRGLEIEAFVHGAMCVSYSGRCLLSNFFTGRDSNRGMCAQPCRWNYYAEIFEEKRMNERMPVFETERGTFIMSSRDMCMIEHIPELVECGIDSFKIEGRMKSAYYAAVTANAYRMATDEYMRGRENYKYNPSWLCELLSVSHREYYTGYWFDDAMQNANVVSAPGYIREKAYIAVAKSFDGESGIATFIQRNKVSSGDDVEIISPGCIGKKFNVGQLFDDADTPIETAPHPSMIFKMKVPFAVKAGDIIRGA